jgi:hypothetical protein
MESVSALVTMREKTLGLCPALHFRLARIRCFLGAPEENTARLAGSGLLNTKGGTTAAARRIPQKYLQSV